MIVKCVSDGADVTDVTIEDLVSCGKLAQLEANRYLLPGPLANYWLGPGGPSASGRTTDVY